MADLETTVPFRSDLNPSETFSLSLGQVPTRFRCVLEGTDGSALIPPLSFDIGPGTNTPSLVLQMYQLLQARFPGADLSVQIAAATVAVAAQ